MNERRDPMIERVLNRVVGSGLHPAQILAAVEDALQGGMRGGRVPNLVTVSFHPADLARYQPALRELEREIRDLVGRQGGAAEAALVMFERAEGLALGDVRATARFADTAHRPAVVPRGATQRILRHSGVRLVLGDGTRVPLTHTPFGLGRGAGNDLVLLSFAVSRDHARILYEPEGFVIEDLGSRNGIEVEGQRQERALLEATRPVRVGDVDIWLERGT